MEDNCPNCGLTPCHPRCSIEIEAQRRLRQIKVQPKR